MERQATIKDYARMCTTCGDICKGCPLDDKTLPFSCSQMIQDEPDKASELILKWCDEHPAKTRQSEIMRIIPNIKMQDDYIDLCPNEIDNGACIVCLGYINSPQSECEKCKRKYWLSEVDE